MGNKEQTEQRSTATGTLPPSNATFSILFAKAQGKVSKAGRSNTYHEDRYSTQMHMRPNRSMEEGVAVGDV